MPLYTFKCETCGKEFDRKQSLEEFDRGEMPQNEECTEDKSKCSIRRVISPLKATSTTWKSWRT